MPMRPGGEVLQLLRARPGIAVRAWGFKVVGGSPIGACTVACQQYREGPIGSTHSRAKPQARVWCRSVSPRGRWC